MDFGYVLGEKLMELVNGQAVGNERKRISRLLLGFGFEPTVVWCCHWLKVKNPGRRRGWEMEMESFILDMLSF